MWQHLRAMSPTPDFVRDLAMVLCVAAVTTVLFRRLRQPVVLGYLLAGLLVGPHVPFPVFADPASVRPLSDLGVILVMFGIGLGFSPRRLAALLPSAGLVGVIEISGMVYLGYLAGQLLGFGPLASLFTGATLCASSTIILARVFEEERLSDARVGLAFGVTMFEDLAAVALLSLLTALSGRVPGDFGMTALKLVLLLIAMVAAGWLVVPRALRAVARLGSAETLLVASVGAAFALALVATKLGYSAALGAFLAGSLLAESGHAETIEKLVRPVRDVFAAVFFVAAGMTIQPLAVVEHWPTVLLLLAVGVIGKLLAVTLGALLSGHDVRTSVETGLSLLPLGEYSYILAGVGVARGVLPDWFLPVIVAVSVVTAFLTPYLVRGSEAVSLAVERKLPHALQTFITLYGTWLERLRQRRRAGRSPARRLVLLLAVDALALAALVAGTSLALEPLRRLVHERLGWDSVPEDWVVLAGAAVLAAPLLIGLVAASRRLGRLLAERVLPPSPAGRADFGAAPRRALLVSLQVGVLLAVGGPLLAVTQPFVPPASGLVVLLLLALAAGLAFWRRATDLEAHVRAGAEVLLEALQAAGGPAASAEQGTRAIEMLLPGLGAVREVLVGRGTRADGATLRGLDLRGRTGATVMAIRRGEQHLASPGGSTRLQADDVLAVAGTQEAQQAAADLLAAPRPLDVT